MNLNKIDFAYSLKTREPLPLNNSEVAKMFTPDEHLMFANAIREVYIFREKNHPNSHLEGRWKLEIDLAKIIEYCGDMIIPIRSVVYVHQTEKR